MQTGLRNGASLRSGIVLDDLGNELLGKISTASCLVFGRQGVSKTHNNWYLCGLALSRYVSRGVSGGTTFGLHVKRRLFFVDIIGTLEIEDEAGVVLIIEDERGKRARSRVYVKGKEGVPGIFSFWNLWSISQPGISEALAFSFPQ